MHFRAWNILLVLIWDWFAVRATVFSHCDIICTFLIVRIFLYLFQTTSSKRKARTYIPDRCDISNSITEDTNKKEIQKAPVHEVLSSNNNTAPLKKLTPSEIEYFIGSFRNYTSSRKEAQSKPYDRNLDKSSISIKNDYRKENKKLADLTHEDSPSRNCSQKLKKLTEEEINEFVESFKNHLNNQEKFQSTIQDRILLNTKITADKQDIKENEKKSALRNEDIPAINTSETLSNHRLTEIKNVVDTVKKNLRMMEKVWYKYKERIPECLSLTIQSEDVIIEDKLLEIKKIVEEAEINLNEVEQIQSKIQERDSESKPSTVEKENTDKPKHIQKFKAQIDADSLANHSPIRINQSKLSEIKEVFDTANRNLQTIENMWSIFQARNSERTYITDQAEDTKIEAKILEIKQVLVETEKNIVTVEKINNHSDRRKKYFTAPTNEDFSTKYRSFQKKTPSIEK